MENNNTLSGAKELAGFLRIGITNAYALAHREGFPVVWITKKRFIVPVDRPEDWLGKQEDRVETSATNKIV